MKALPLNSQDIYLFHKGENYQAYKMLGAHPCELNGVHGVRFALWAERVRAVFVVGDFNSWQPREEHQLIRQGESQIWAVFVPDLPVGTLYKYLLINDHGEHIYKADPFAFAAQLRPGTSSSVYPLGTYPWQDQVWQEQKNKRNSLNEAMLIYEVHLGSWRLNAERSPFSYAELADKLVNYVLEMGYTHVEFLPLAEHPFDGSWGYQITGYFAPTSRYGSPNDLKYLIDVCHQNGLGVILDWSPGHFCRDAHGLRKFNGYNMFESDNPLLAENPEWGTTNFDYGRTEVMSFLISNAFYWFDEFHVDGLRIDAVSNMLYLNYARGQSGWIPNKYGGSGNLEAIEFLKRLNIAVFEFFPKALMLAEESTDWPQMSAPVYAGGMGFNYKWNMGWMNDFLRYVKTDFADRKDAHKLLTFSLMYAFAENYVLPLSHDEVVHGKCSLLSKMPGTYEEKFVQLKLFMAYWMAHPGKKLLFMGGEFAQVIEWKDTDSLDWHLLDYPIHKDFHDYMKALNLFYCRYSELWELDTESAGFEWLDCNDNQRSILALQRKNKNGDFIVGIFNFMPVEYRDYQVAMPAAGVYSEIFSNHLLYRGLKLTTDDVEYMGRSQAVKLDLLPFAAVFLRREDL